MKKGISVVICSYNSEKRIKKVLGCLLEQQNHDKIEWEVIMVDNASTDNSVALAKKLWNHPRVPLHIISETKQGQSFATLTGIKNAVYDIIIMVDDDNYVSPNYISRAYEIMEKHPEVGIAGGKGTGVFEEDPPAWFKDYEQALAIGPQADSEGYVDDRRGYIYGAGSIIRKPVYDYLIDNNFKLMLKGRIGKSLVAGEDSERSHAFRILGYKLWYDPSLEFGHQMPPARIDWKYIRKLYKSFGRASAYHGLYEEVLKNPKGLSSFVAKSMFLTSLYALYSALLVLPAYILISISGSDVGKKKVIRFDYTWGRLTELLTNMKKVMRYRKRLKQAEWRVNNSQ
ncbi:MAG: glycosyltransferase family 2 protein [Bacteroidales bacterium]|nr:MAG: glycosyltransferase family 2 protein [Bacteroidales bacterium]